MTLCIAMQSKDSLIFGSDSRATIGDPMGLVTANDTIQKTFKLTDHCGLLMAGAGELGMTLLNQASVVLNQQPNSNLLSVDQIVKIIQPVFVQGYNQWFGQAPPPGRPPLVLIVGGYTKDNNELSEPRIYTLLSQLNFAPSTNSMGFAAGGVIPLAVYLLNRLYVRDINHESALVLSAFCICETASQDGKVGGPVQLAYCSKTKPYYALTRQEIDNILKEAQEHNKRLRDAFLAAEPTA